MSTLRAAIIIEPGTGWHGDNYRVKRLHRGETDLLRIFAELADAQKYRDEIREQS